jgi:hypothetical protein
MRPTRILRLPIFKKSSYYDSDYRQSAALIRARRPYIFKNALTGSAIAAFAISVCKRLFISYVDRLLTDSQSPSPYALSDKIPSTMWLFPAMKANDLNPPMYNKVVRDDVLLSVGVSRHLLHQRYWNHCST